MLRKFDRYARRDSFRGDTRGEFGKWRSETRSLLHGLLGLDKMEDCGLSPALEDVLLLPGGIRREHIRIQVEPDVWMPMFVLVPPGAGCSSRPFICPPGHNGAGKYSVAGLDGYGPVRDKIRQYHYDYGYQLAKLGYVAVCPDCRGFGERREDLEDPKDAATAMKGDCYRLAHMGGAPGHPCGRNAGLGFDARCGLPYGTWGMGYGGYCQPDCPKAPSYPVLPGRQAERAARDCQCRGAGGHYPECIQADRCARPCDS